jgi:hypothetical protein
VSAVWCDAVGSWRPSQGAATNTYNALVEHWNGKVWTVVSVPHSPSGTFREMESVSCATTTFCVAVGYEVSSAVIPRAWLWNGQSWKFMTLPAPAKETDTLNAVSCPAVDSCYAVGKKLVAGRTADPPLVEHWNGKKWQAIFAPAPDQWIWELDDVWCGKFAPGQFHCVAVGQGQPFNAAGHHGFIERFNGTTWSIPNFPDPWPTASVLNSVACSSLSFCVAAGETDPLAVNPSPYSLELSGGTWSTLDSSAIPGASKRFGVVGCSVSAGCYQAGNNYDNSQGRVQMLRLVGTQWQAVTSAQPPVWTGTPPLHSYSPFGMSCTTLQLCVAVGEHDIGSPKSATLPLVLTKQ